VTSTAVSFGLADFKTGSRILTLPVLEGASWAAMLNRPDALSCAIDLRDPDVRALDPVSTTAPKKTVLFAEAPNGRILAWGRIAGRKWSDDERKLEIRAAGGWSYFDERIIAPADAATATDIILPDGKVSTAYDTTLAGLTLGSIGKRLVEQALDWPGAPVSFILPADTVGTRTDTWRLVDYKRVGAALSDLTKREDGPDFAFEARRTLDELALEFHMLVGEPLLGSDVGSWPLGGPEPVVTGFEFDEDGAGLSTHVWMQSGRTDSKVLVAREVNDALIESAGYPPLDFVDTSRGDVTEQTTLDDYAREHSLARSTLTQTASFSVKGNASLALGQYGPGDWAALSIPAGHPFLAEGDLPLRVLGISGDETGTDVKIACELGSMP
jgi:hypothetical protein